jgi:hypothetical protein
VQMMFDLANNFKWSEAPLNSIEWPIGVAIFYLATCVGHRACFGDMPRPLAIWKYVEWFIPYHNIFLSLISAAMFFGCGSAAITKSFAEGSIEWLFCDTADASGKSGPLAFWCYIYYLSKYYELLDTWFQIIRGKYPPHYFLHAYHHSVVLLMCWCWLEYSVSLRYIALMFNVFVHIVMYYYFYLKCINISPWWKKYVTSLQIVQFACSFMLCAYSVYLSAYLGYTCSGMGLLYAQVVFNATLFTGFVDVLKKTDSPVRSNMKKRT